MTDGLRMFLSAGVSEAEWDDFVLRCPGGHHTQSSPWGTVQAGRGWAVDRMVISDGSTILAGAQILTRVVKGAGSVAYVDRGPLAIDDSPELLAEVVDHLRRHLRVNRIRLAVIHPPDTAHQLGALLASSGFGPSYFKSSLEATTVLDLTRTPDEILAGMKSKTRYNVRLGLRSGMEVRQGTREDLPVFHAMLEKTAERQGFVPNSLQYLEDIYDTLGPWSQVFLAEYEGQAVAGMLAMTFGDTFVYKRGAWSGEEAARRPNEVMHWGAIQWAVEHGFTRYDFDGIEPDIARAVLDGKGIPGSAVDSVTRFKLGFGGDVVLLPQVSTYLPNRLLRFGHDHVYPLVADKRLVRRLVRNVRIG